MYHHNESTLNAGLDHPVDGPATTTAHADNTEIGRNYAMTAFSRHCRPAKCWITDISDANNNL